MADKPRCALKWILLILIFLFFSFCAQGEDKIVVINSENWQDIYSGIVYANLNGIPFDFLITEKDIVYQPVVLENFDTIALIESQDNPIVKGYRFNLKADKLNVEQVSITKNINLDLAKLTYTKNFILLDSKYPHNAVSVTPYSTLTKAYVLFADKNNAEDILSFLEEKKPKSLLIYGLVDTELKTALSKFYDEGIVEEINAGDKFGNNIEITKKYNKINSGDIVTLTSGNFLEKQMMKGLQPILFIGEKDVSEDLFAYLKQSNFFVGEVIGNELTKSASKLKKALEKEGKSFSVFIRFGQGTTLKGAENIRKISSLDLFYLPGIAVNVTVSKIDYNRASKQLEVAYQNLGEISVYTKSTIKVLIGEKRAYTVGDDEPFFMLSRENKTIIYALDMSEQEPLNKKDLKGEILAQYGESAKSLDSILEITLPINITEVKDRSSLEAIRLTYSADLYKKLIPGISKEKIVKLKIRNNGKASAYYKPAVLLKTNGADQAYTKEGTLKISAKTVKTSQFMVDFDGVDLKEKAKVDIVYGAKKDVLIKRLQKEIKLTPTYWADLVILCIILLLTSIALIIFFKRKDLF